MQSRGMQFQAPRWFENWNRSHDKHVLRHKIHKATVLFLPRQHHGLDIRASHCQAWNKYRKSHYETISTTHHKAREAHIRRIFVGTQPVPRTHRWNYRVHKIYSVKDHQHAQKNKKDLYRRIKKPIIITCRIDQRPHLHVPPFHLEHLDFLQPFFLLWLIWMSVDFAKIKENQSFNSTRSSSMRTRNGVKKDTTRQVFWSESSGARTSAKARDHGQQEAREGTGTCIKSYFEVKKTSSSRHSARAI